MRIYTVLILILAILGVPSVSATEDSIIIEKNLFSPTRTPQESQEQIAEPNRSKKQNFLLQLDAVFIDGNRKRAMIVYRSEGSREVETYWVGEGDVIDDKFKVISIAPLAVNIKSSQKVEELKLHGKKFFHAQKQSMPDKAAKTPTPKPQTKTD